MALTKIGTDGVKDDAVTSDKVANSINSAIAANTAKTQTTINNNADNRVITGSGTANTLEGEANLTFDGSVLTNTGSTVIGNDIKSGTDDPFIYSYKGGSDGQVRSGIQLDGTNQRMEFYTGTNERMRIDSSGKVGIGMTTVGAALDVNGASGDTLRLSNGSALYQYRIGRNSADGKLEFRGTQSGDEVYSFGGASGEKIRFQAGGGISFNGDTAAANALDDYEEGTFTPSINAGFTVGYTTQTGKYTKIGNTVTFQIYIAISSISGSSSNTNARINGLPFTAKDTALGYGVSVPWIYLLGQNVTRGYVQEEATYIELLNNPSGGNREHTSANSCWDQNSLYISVAGSYLAD